MIAEYYAWEEQFFHLKERKQLVLVVPTSHADEENIDKPVLDFVTHQLNTTPTSEEKSRCTGNHKQQMIRRRRGLYVEFSVRVTTGLSTARGVNVSRWMLLKLARALK